MTGTTTKPRCSKSVLCLLPSEFEEGDAMTVGGNVTGPPTETPDGLVFTLVEPLTGKTTTRVFNTGRSFAVVRGSGALALAA